MRLVRTNSMRLNERTTRQGRNLVQNMDGLLLIGDERCLVWYSHTLDEVARTPLPGMVTDIGGASGWFFAVCEGTAFYGRHDQDKLETLADTIWGDENDHFTICGQHFWYVSRGTGTAVCAFDLMDKIVECRFSLDSTWEGGSFSIWPGPEVVAVEVPMDCKLGLASCSGCSRFEELRNEWYV